MPVYNDEKYLSDSLDSILRQSFKDIEVICINDGSTDNSLNILTNYKDKFKWMKIISQENQGSGIARNVGIKEATGEYLSFLDSDDIFVDKDALLKMYNTAIKYNSDMVSANLKGITVNGDLVNNDNLKRFDEEKIISPEEYEIPYSFYKNIIKKSFLIDNKIKFPNLKRGQDPVFLAEVLINLKEIPVVPIDLYGFRYAINGGLSKINTYEKKRDYLLHFKETFDILDSANFNEMKTAYEDKLKLYLTYPGNSEDTELHEIVKLVFKEHDSILDMCYHYLRLDKIKISVVVPVYNAEEFLEESINSVLNQTLKDIEIICVNDGSKDNSLQMLNEFARRDNRVKVFDKENGGCGSARNFGLERAKGRYIYFFDPDDYILPNAFEKLYDNAINNDSDLVLFKIARFRDGEEVDYSIPGFDFDNVFNNVNFNSFTFNYKDIKNYVLNSSFAPWSKLYKKEFLDRYDDFTFETGIAFDDVPFHVQSLLRAEKMSFIPEFFYHYRLSNPNSVNNTKSNQIGIIKICDIVYNFLLKEGYYDEFKNEFLLFKVTQFLNYIISSNSVTYFDKVKEEFKNMDFSSKHVPSVLLKKVNAVLYSPSYQNYRRLILDNSKKKISIIIPVYNTEKYLSNCLDSLLNQTIDEIEILAIDDGSEDDSLSILKEYADKDDRIKIFSKKHNGAGSARNIGLDYSNAEYINFVDSDDWLDNNCLEEAYNYCKMNNLDMLMYLLINQDESGKVYRTDYYDINCVDKKWDNLFNYKDVKDALFDIPVSPCNKLISASLISKLNLRFVEGFMFEDNPFFFRLFLSSKRNAIIRKHFYFRRRHENSIMNNRSKKLADILPITTEIINIFKEFGIYEEFKIRLLNFKLYSIRTYYNQLSNEIDKVYFFNVMKEDFEINNKSIKDDFNNSLYSDTLSFFNNVLISDSFINFDLRMELYNLQLKVNNSEAKINYMGSNENSNNKLLLDKIYLLTNENSELKIKNRILLDKNKMLMNKVSFLRNKISEINKKKFFNRFF